MPRVLLLLAISVVSTVAPAQNPPASPTQQQLVDWLREAKKRFEWNAPGAPGYHLTGTYVLTSADGKQSSGKLDILRLTADESSQIITGGALASAIYRHAGKSFYVPDGETVIPAARSGLTRDFVALEFNSRFPLRWIDSTKQSFEYVATRDKSVDCIEEQNIAKTSKPVRLCLDAATHDLRSATLSDGTFRSWDGVQPFGQFFVPREISATTPAKSRILVHIDSLTPVRATEVIVPSQAVETPSFLFGGIRGGIAGTTGPSLPKQ